MRVLSSIILSVLTCGITPLKINFKTFTGLRGKGYKLSDGFVNQTLDNISLIPCINTCSTVANCRSVSWNSDNQKCLFGLTDVTNYVEASTQLSEVSGWNTYSLMKYTGEPGCQMEALAIFYMIGLQFITVRYLGARGLFVFSTSNNNLLSRKHYETNLNSR